MNQEAPSLQSLQEEVDNWITTVGVRYFNELTNLAILTEEVGELARIIARRYGEQSEKESDRGADLGDEMADVLWVLMALHASTKKGTRPSFIRAAHPEHAIPIYTAFVSAMDTLIDKPVATGQFGADMQVQLINDGPVTIWIDTKNKS